MNILNPKASALLQNLVDLKLISIEEREANSFSDILKRIRSKAGKQAPSLEEITNEVEATRKKRFKRDKA